MHELEPGHGSDPGGSRSRLWMAHGWLVEGFGLGRTILVARWSVGAVSGAIVHPACMVRASWSRQVVMGSVLVLGGSVMVRARWFWARIEG